MAYQKYVGRGTCNVELLPGTVFLDVPPHPLSGYSSSNQTARILQGRKRVRKCLVFSCSLFQKSIGTDETTGSVSNRFEFDVDKRKEEERLLKLGVDIVYSGIGVVFCQRQVHPRLAEFLEWKNVAVFNRLGVARIGRVGRVCGCRVVNDWEGESVRVEKARFMRQMSSADTSICEVCAVSS